MGGLPEDGRAAGGVAWSCAGAREAQDILGMRN